MAHDQKDAPAHAPTHDQPQTYEVGYSKPPAANSFKPGQSGSPRGRLKGSKNLPPPIGANTLQDIILKEAYRPIPDNDGAKQVTMPMATAVMRSIAVNAAKGQPRSQKLFTDILSKAESQRRQEYEESRSAFLQIQHNWDDRILHCRATGEPIPNPAPHPDDLGLTRRQATSLVLDPSTKRTKNSGKKFLIESRDLKEISKSQEETSQIPKIRT